MLDARLKIWSSFTGAIDLEPALKSYLANVNHNSIAERLSFSVDKFDVWTRAHILLPPVRDLVKSAEYMTVICAPESSSGWRKKTVAAQFSTVLIIHDREASGIHRKRFIRELRHITYQQIGFLAAQVRAVFQLPQRFGQNCQEHLAYVELFTPFKEQADEDGTYSVKRSMRRGKRANKVIRLSDIILGCHLVAEIKGKATDKGLWASETAFEKGNIFHLNIFSSVYMYMLMYHNKLFC